MHDIGVPRRLSEVGVREEHIPLMVPQSVVDGCHPSNPRPCTAEDFDRMFREAL